MANGDTKNESNPSWIDIGVDPLAEEVTEIVHDISELVRSRNQRRQEALAKFEREYDTIVQEARDRLSVVLDKVATSRANVKPDGRKKAKKKWREIALAIEEDPDAGYHELSKAIYGSVTTAHLKTLRATVYKMRQAHAIDGEPGAWKLLKKPDEIAYMEVDEASEHGRSLLDDIPGFSTAPAPRANTIEAALGGGSGGVSLFDRVPTTISPATVPAKKVPQWKRIYDWCFAHPRPSGMYDTGELAPIVFPNETLSRGKTLVYVAVMRKSPQSDLGTCRDPKFVWFGDRRFKLYDPNELPPLDEENDDKW